MQKGVEGLTKKLLDYCTGFLPKKTEGNITQELGCLKCLCQYLPSFGQLIVQNLGRSNCEEDNSYFNSVFRDQNECLPRRFSDILGQMVGILLTCFVFLIVADFFASFTTYQWFTDSLILCTCWVPIFIVPYCYS